MIIKYLAQFVERRLEIQYNSRARRNKNNELIISGLKYESEHKSITIILSPQKAIYLSRQNERHF